jgi:membrane-bound lytic murein transglycosylase D
VAVGDVTQVEGEAPVTVPVTVADPKPKAAPVRTYRVARGDTLGRIAQKHDCDLKSLARANGLKAPAYCVRPGQTIKLEGCK